MAALFKMFLKASQNYLIRNTNYLYMPAIPRNPRNIPRLSFYLSVLEGRFTFNNY